MSETISPSYKEELNHMAYIAVLNRKDPENVNSEYYMKSYTFWSSISRELDDERIL